MQSINIIAHQRSGSTSLGYAISQCIGLPYVHEPTNKNSKKWLIQPLPSVCVTKYMLDYGNLDIKPILELSKTTPTIFLYRDNVFATAMSLYTAKLTECWNKEEKSNSGVNYYTKISEHTIDSKKFVSELEYAATRKYIIKTLPNSLISSIILYEELFTNTSEITERIFYKLEKVCGRFDRQLFKWYLDSYNMGGKGSWSMYKNFDEIKEMYDNIV